MLEEGTKAVPRGEDASRGVGEVEDDGGSVNHPPSDDVGEEAAEEKEEEVKLKNYSASDSGAVVLAASKGIKGVNNVLLNSKDKYAITPCEEKQWFVVSLSEDIVVKEIMVGSYEKYSSTAKEVQVLGSQTYPTSSWVDLGTFTAKFGQAEQEFVLEQPAFARYLKFRFLSHYGDEYYCTVSQVKVFGSTFIESIQSEWLEIQASAGVVDEPDAESVEALGANAEVGIDGGGGGGEADLEKGDDVGAEEKDRISQAAGTATNAAAGETGEALEEPKKKEDDHIGAVADAVPELVGGEKAGLQQAVPDVGECPNGGAAPGDVGELEAKSSDAASAIAGGGADEEVDRGEERVEQVEGEGGTAEQERHGANPSTTPSAAELQEAGEGELVEGSGTEREGEGDAVASAGAPPKESLGTSPFPPPSSRPHKPLSSCGERLTFAEFRDKKLADNPQPNPKSVAVGGQYETIFKTLMQKIKAVEIDQGMVDLYVEEVHACYEEDLEALHQRQLAVEGQLERLWSMKETRSQALGLERTEVTGAVLCWVFFACLVTFGCLVKRTKQPTLRTGRESSRSLSLPPKVL